MAIYSERIVAQIKEEIANQKEALQDDLISVLDGLDDSVIDTICEIVVERFTSVSELVDAIYEEGGN